MILVQAIIISPSFSLPQIFWKVLSASVALYDTFRTHAAYSIALGKILTDHKDILGIIAG